MNRDRQTCAIWRASIATLLAVLFAVGSILAVNPVTHAWLHADHAGSEHHHTHDSEESEKSAEECFLCLLATNGLGPVDADPQILIAQSLNQTITPEIFCPSKVKSDCQLPPILAPPLV